MNSKIRKTFAEMSAEQKRKKQRKGKSLKEMTPEERSKVLTLIEKARNGGRSIIEQLRNAETR